MCKLADNCKYGSLCPYLYDAPGVTVTGCSRYKENKPRTNADRIRAMTDEELAEWIMKRDCHTDFYGYYRKDAVLDWLKQEVKE